MNVWWQRPFVEWTFGRKRLIVEEIKWHFVETMFRRKDIWSNLISTIITIISQRFARPFEFLVFQAAFSFSLVFWVEKSWSQIEASWLLLFSIKLFLSALIVIIQTSYRKHLKLVFERIMNSINHYVQKLSYKIDCRAVFFKELWYYKKNNKFINAKSSTQCAKILLLKNHLNNHRNS